MSAAIGKMTCEQAWSEQGYRKAERVELHANNVVIRPKDGAEEVGLTEFDGYAAFSISGDVFGKIAEIVGADPTHSYIEYNCATQRKERRASEYANFEIMKEAPEVGYKDYIVGVWARPQGAYMLDLILDVVWNEGERSILQISYSGGYTVYSGWQDFCHPNDSQP